VYKNIPAFVTGYKARTFIVVEPLNNASFTLCHKPNLLSVSISTNGAIERPEAATKWATTLSPDKNFVKKTQFYKIIV
jgi:hypothetical protein